MNKLYIPNYNLKSTLLGGQSFSWEYIDGYFWGQTSKRAIKLAQAGDIIYWQTYPVKNDIDFIKNYLRLDVDYKKIIQILSRDSKVKVALSKFPGLRILRQDFDQTVISFIISAKNNIPAIRKILKRMSEKLGRPINIDGKTVYLFPETQKIASAPLEDLINFKMGFRAKYVKEAAKFLLKTNLSSKIKNLPENEARRLLKTIPGVGDKIADCILVYALSFDNVTPLDVWGKRIAHKIYGLPPNLNYETIRNRLSNIFGGYASWAWQFLYEYFRGQNLIK